MDGVGESAAGRPELGIPLVTQHGEDQQREVQPVKEVARIKAPHREAGQQTGKVLQPVPLEMAVVLIIVGPELLPCRQGDDERPEGRKRLSTPVEKVVWLGKVFQDVEKQGNAYRAGQIGRKVGNIATEPKMRRDGGVQGSRLGDLHTNTIAP
jgi:hypothetical protein